jgi:hypothetical protein
MNVEEYTDEPATAEISVIREPSIEYARNKEIPTFFGQPLVKGSFSHTRIVSPSQQSYIFYQYDEAHGYRITRPLNANLLPFHRVPRRFLHPIREVYRVLGRSQEISETNHFLGYTVALNRLDGVYYVDPRPEMLVNERLREQIFDFQKFLVEDLWTFSANSPQLPTDNDVEG